MSLVKYAYAVFAGGVMVTSQAVLRAGNECCADTWRCWDLHDYDPNYWCCAPPPTTAPCSKDEPFYCKDTSGSGGWCS